MDKDSAHKSELSQPTPVSPRDGLIDFGGYSIEQLRELQFSIDAAAYPENFKNLQAALKQKEESIAKPTAGDNGYVGRFTSDTGFLGWLQAKIGRSPVYGIGSIQLESSGVLLNGWQRTWLGVPIETLVTRDIADVRNVVQDGLRIRFDIRRKFRPTEHIKFQPESATGGLQLVEKLPKIESPGFSKRWSAVRDLNQKLDAISGTPRVTSAIVILNALVFATMAVATKKIGLFGLQEMLNWGANFAPLTVNGQWWRLFTALFLHFSLLHIAVNMWALWNIGRLSERLFGHGTFLILYIGAGILASLSSIAWDPSLSSVGASGAIFGIFGSFLAFIARQPHQIPATIARKYWISTAVFVLFNLLSGAIQPGIDNAAHVGGLLAGFVLGFFLARPLDAESRRHLPIQRGLAAAAFVALAVFLAIWLVNGNGSELTIPERYLREHREYASGEEKNLRLWSDLAARAGAGSISDAEMAEHFEREILPFWQKQKDLMKKDGESAKGSERDFALLVAEFADLRYQWASAVIDATKNRDSSRGAEALTLMNRTAAVQAKLERIGVRSRLDHRLRGLAGSLWVNRVRQFFSGAGRNCVTAPVAWEPVVADSDKKNDGPAMRHELGCRAQQWFLSGDYGRLDSSMNHSMAALEDLPDGSSSYEGLVAGISDLIDTLRTETALQHTADWRHAVRGSAMADLAEAMVFRSWAWSARGFGYANSITQQNMALYEYRSNMAEAALSEVAPRAVDNPLWYTLSLEIGLDQGKDREKLQAIFDQGHARVPNYGPLYRRMLRILMPRWGGSYEDVDKFINKIYGQTAPSRGFERYAQLYSVYARAEGDDLDLFRDTPAFWSGMRTGYLGLVKRYPTSDVVLNSFANFACRAGDSTEYKRLGTAVKERPSSTAWSAKYSIDACDKQLAPGGNFRAPQAIDGVPTGRIVSLGGVRIGMTRAELLAAKGNPNLKEASYWVYNTIDSKHDGVITAVFSTPRQGSEETVLAIAYEAMKNRRPQNCRI